MSTTLSLQGVRGGVGVTTMIAALGHALHAQGERVLLVECTPDHLLGLHLGLPAAEARGWARAWLDDGDWREAAFEALPGLALLPYGCASDAEVATIEERLRRTPRFWAERLPLLAAQFDWILFGCRSGCKRTSTRSISTPPARCRCGWRRWTRAATCCCSGAHTMRAGCCATATTRRWRCSAI